MIKDTESVRQRRYALCKLLSNGKFHSGAELAEHFSMSRAAIWKNIQALKEYGLKIDSVHGKGYRISRPPEMLDKKVIEAKLSSSIKEQLQKIEIFFDINSTNSYLLSMSPSQSIHGRVVLAEYQSQGRGRRGNQWYSPLAAGVNLSIGWRYHELPEALQVLSLGIGTQTFSVLESFQIENLGLKWPNDILCQSKKLAGILVETRSESAGFTDIVLGLGLNISLPQNSEHVEQTWIDLKTVCNILPSRNELVVGLMTSYVEFLKQLPSLSSRQVVADWRQYECISGSQAELETSQGMIQGQVLDVDDTGALLFSTRKGTRRYTTGQIKLRLEK